MAEGILRNKAEKHGIELTIDSAGTGNWHVGQHPDRRAIQTAKTFGVDISKLIGRQFQESDFDEFDRIYVMDKSNLSDVLELARTAEHRDKVNLLLVAGGCGDEVPDPYYGGQDGFNEVFRMMDKACDSIIKDLKK
jgi:protein-tyrosine phosphatase